MYGLPEDFDCNRLVGLELGNVAFSANTVTLMFEKNVAINLEISYRYSLGAGEHEFEERVAPAASALMQLANRRVIGASVHRRGDLRLELEGGLLFTCLDDPHYESYSIFFGDERIIV